MVKVTVKWNKQVFQEVDVAPTVEAFKRKLHELTGVPPARQKLMAKGAWKGVLKDGADLSACPIKAGQQVMLMGSAEVVEDPKEVVRFVEDMKDQDLAESGAALPAGFVNLGNTCYMNSTLQCIRKVPELREALSSFKSGSAAAAGEDLSTAFAVALRDTYNSMDRSTEAAPPVMFLQILRTMFPQFAEQGPRGGFKQQDAEELYNAIVSTLSRSLIEPPSSTLKEGDEVLYKGADGKEERGKVVKVHHDVEEVHYTVRLGTEGREKNTDIAHLKKAHALESLGGAGNLVDALFGLELEEEVKCDASGECRTLKAKARKLVCNIQGGAGSNAQINHLSEGVSMGLKGEVTKKSEVLGTDAVFSLTSRVSRLPRYLCVQVMRFFWKATPDSQDHAGVKCKIMRPVTFPNILDVYEFCSPSLQAILKVPRDEADRLLFEGEKAQQTLEKGVAGEDTGKSGGKTTEVDASGKGDGVEESKESSKMDSMDVEVEGSGEKVSKAGEAAVAGAVATAVSTAAGDDDDNDDDELQAALAMSMEVVEDAPEEPVQKEGAAGPGLPADFMGKYELFAVVTHKGREADGGHYMGWVRQEGDNWLVFDDADVSPCKTEDVVNLKGGGDWHMAYLTFYRFKE